MPTTQIPPDSPVAVPGARPEGSDLYDAQRWESVYQDLHATPALLIQLQDDLARARRREALWMSVVVHLTIIILFVNSAKIGGLFPKRTVFVVPASDWMRQKELTYLELPPDEQKVAKKPDSDIISDKDRIATSRTPQIDRKELKKILDSARAGRPGEPNPPGQEAQAASPPAVAGQNGPQPQQPSPPLFSQNQTAQLQMPPRPGSKPTFNTNPVSPGSAIQQAARAAAANRGGYGGERGDFGLGQGQRGQAQGNLDILSDTQGVDFGPYLNRILHAVRENWYLHIPESVRDGKKGKLAIEFAILKDGSIAGMQLTNSSGDIPLDRAAWAGITDSNPFPPLPAEFPGQYLSLRFRFYYNPDQSDLQ
jgi:TonB family protein